MTNFEYLVKRTKGLGTSDDDIELILLKGDLEGTDPADMKACDMAIHRNFSIIRKASVEKIKEGDYAIERSMTAIDAFWKSLVSELSEGTAFYKYF